MAVLLLVGACTKNPPSRPIVSNSTRGDKTAVTTPDPNVPPGLEKPDIGVLRSRPLAPDETVDPSDPRIKPGIGHRDIPPILEKDPTYVVDPAGPYIDDAGDVGADLYQQQLERNGYKMDGIGESYFSFYLKGTPSNYVTVEWDSGSLSSAQFKILVDVPGGEKG
jgi:hypothetical protein